MSKRVLLCIMDGWGIAKDSLKDATKTANTPNIDKYYKEEKNIQIFADGEHVGFYNKILFECLPSKLKIRGF